MKTIIHWFKVWFGSACPDIDCPGEMIFDGYKHDVCNTCGHKV